MELKQILDREDVPLDIKRMIKDSLSKHKQVEEVLRKTEEKFRALVESTSDWIWEVDVEGIYTYVSPRIVDLLGYEPEEAIGKTSFDFMPIFEAKRVSRLFKDIIDSQEPFKRLENTCIHKDGQHVVLETSGVPLFDDSGNLIGYRGIDRDISEHMKMEETLKKSEELYYDLYENAPDMLASVDPRTTTIIRCNQTLVTSLGYRKEEIIGKPVYELYHPECLEDYKKTFQSFVKIGEVHGAELQLKRKDGSKIDVSLNVSAVRDEEGDILYSRSALRDITERKQAEEALQESEERLRAFMESATENIFLLDSGLNIVDLNKISLKLMGLNKEDIVGKNIADIAPSIKETGRYNKYMNVIKTGEPMVEDDVVFLPNHAARHFTVRSFKVGDGLGIISTDVTERKQIEENLKKYSKELEETINKLCEAQKQLVDIAELKKIEEELRKSLKEKDVLLQEIHHRVKNNLQVISSLLSLQSEYIEDKQTLEMFQKSQDRIKSIALIHEKLYSESEDLTRIDFASYVHDLTTKLFSSYGINLEIIKLNIDIKDVLLDITLAIPCGLIINELLSNSLKHAFPDNREGEINIRLRKSNENEFTLILGDNGVGLPLDIDFPKIETLGLQLVFTLVNQLEGTIELDRSDGTVFKIQFVKAKDVGQ